MTPASAALANVRCVVLDLDGVIYAGDELLPGAAQTVRGIRDHGLLLYFATNNSTRTRAEIAAKLVRLGIPTAADEVLTSAYAAACLLARLYPAAPRVMVVGSDGLRTELAAAGATVVPLADEPCDVLVVGMDPQFSYERLTLALGTLLRGCRLVACNRDARFPVENGGFRPGCGPLVAAIEAAAGKRPDHEPGKPAALMLELVAQRSGLQPAEILVIGDSLESDIAMAIAFGAPSLLLGDDAPPAAAGRSGNDPPRPSGVLRCLSELFGWLPSSHCRSRNAP